MNLNVFNWKIYFNIWLGKRKRAAIGTQTQGDLRESNPLDFHKPELFNRRVRLFLKSWLKVMMKAKHFPSSVRAVLDLTAHLDTSG